MSTARELVAFSGRTVCIDELSHRAGEDTNADECLARDSMILWPFRKPTTPRVFGMPGLQQWATAACPNGVHVTIYANA